MSKGEFKERMEKEHLRLIGLGKPVDPNQYAQFIHSMLDEARKDFQQYEPSGQDATNIERIGNVIRTVMEMEDWFLKWFGGESKKSQDESDSVCGIPIVVDKHIPKGKAWLIGKPLEKDEKPQIVEIRVNLKTKTKKKVKANE